MTSSIESPGPLTSNLRQRPCYQESDNYGTNVVESMKQYQEAPTSSPLYQNAMTISRRPSSSPTPPHQHPGRRPHVP